MKNESVVSSEVSFLVLQRWSSSPQMVAFSRYPTWHESSTRKHHNWKYRLTRRLGTWKKSMTSGLKQPWMLTKLTFEDRRHTTPPLKQFRRQGQDDHSLDIPNQFDLFDKWDDRRLEFTLSETRELSKDLQFKWLNMFVYIPFIRCQMNVDNMVDSFW